MLRETKNVHEFNAHFKLSRGIPSLLQESRCIDQYNGPNWRTEEYQKAKDAIEPGGNGLGRGCLQHFLPANSVSNPNTLQTAITAYYQERWREEGEKLMEQSRLVGTSNAPRSGATSRIRPVEPFLSRNNTTHDGITSRKLGDYAGLCYACVGNWHVHRILLDYGNIGESVGKQ